MNDFHGMWCACFPHSNGMTPCHWLFGHSKTDAMTRAINDSILMRQMESWHIKTRKQRWKWLYDHGYRILFTHLVPQESITKSELKKRIKVHYR
jgi:hypothetical protein